jgi:hypothetical protein
MNRHIVPSWGLVSVALTPIAPFLGFVGAVVVETLVDKPHGVVTNYFPLVSRSGVLVMLAALLVGAGSSLVSLIRRERPLALAMLGITTNVVLIVAFAYAHYFKLGYDQDRGASPGAGYLTVGEGLTVASTNEEMQAAFHLFPAVPGLAARCMGTPGVARLTAARQARLRLEEPFALKSLDVAALDASGSIVASVPVTIEVEEMTPPILYFFENRLQHGPTAHSAGSFRFRVRTMCPGPRIDVTIPARAVHPG